jgi:hypothetical protein
MNYNVFNEKIFLPRNNAVPIYECTRRVIFFNSRHFYDRVGPFLHGLGAAAELLARLGRPGVNGIDFYVGKPLIKRLAVSYPNPVFPPVIKTMLITLSFLKNMVANYP